MYSRAGCEIVTYDRLDPGDVLEIPADTLSDDLAGLTLVLRVDVIDYARPDWVVVHDVRGGMVHCGRPNEEVHRHYRRDPGLAR